MTLTKGHFLAVKIYKQLKLLGQFQLNIICSLQKKGEKKIYIFGAFTLPRRLPCPYVVKTFKIFFRGTGPVALKFGIQYFNVYINDDPGLTLTSFMARSNLSPLKWETLKKCAFLCAVVLCDICNAVDFNPFGFKRSRSVSSFSQILLGWNILNYFSTETIRPGCITNHHFGTVTLCLEKISKFIAETSVQKVSHFRGAIRT